MSARTPTSSAIILCFGTPDECPSCGGSASLGGTQTPLVTRRGRFCSVECAAYAEPEPVVSDWCPTCGYDRHEHAPECSA